MKHSERIPEGGIGFCCADLCGVSGYFKLRTIHLCADACLDAYLALPGNRVLRLSEHLLALHQEAFGSERLAIKPDSFAIEILCHVWVARRAHGVYVLLGRLSRQRLRHAKALALRVESRAGMIDIGDLRADTNRFLWDMLTPFRGLIYRIFGQRGTTSPA